MLPQTVTVIRDIRNPILHHAPIGTNNTVTVDENSSYTFSAGDFGFSDADVPPDNFGLQ